MEYIVNITIKKQSGPFRPAPFMIIVIIFRPPTQIDDHNWTIQKEYLNGVKLLYTLDMEIPNSRYL